MENYNTEEKQSNTRVLALTGALVVAAVLLTGVYFYQDSDFFSQEETLIAQIAEQPQSFRGESVRAIGEVSKIIGSRAFVAHSTDSENNEILIISRQPLVPVGGVANEDFLYDGGDRVAVNGTVREFNLRQIEEELGLDLVDEQFTQWEGRTVIMADSVEEEL